MSKPLTEKDVHQKVKKFRKEAKDATRRNPEFALKFTDSFFVSEAGGRPGGWVLEFDAFMGVFVFSGCVTGIALFVFAEGRFFLSSPVLAVALLVGIFLVSPLFLETFWGWGRAFCRKYTAMTEAIQKIEAIPSETYLIRAFEDRCRELQASVVFDDSTPFGAYVVSMRDRLNRADKATVDDIRTVLEACELAQTDILQGCLCTEDKLIRAQALIEDRKTYTDTDAHMLEGATLTVTDIDGPLYALLTEVRDELGRMQALRSRVLTGASVELD